MIFSVISLFPEMFSSLTDYGVTGRAFKNNICKLNVFNPRDFTTDSYRKVDDRPFGGGPGQVMKIEPLELALAEAVVEQKKYKVTKPLTVHLSPQGKMVDQELVSQLLANDGLILICGRYEGIDERFIQNHVDLELSLGDFVVSGGEIPAMMLLDGIMRHIPGVLNDQESAINDSFMNGLLDYPHYTQPRNYRGGDMVPEVLLSGDHEKIKKWRLQMSLLRTYQRRQDLLAKRKLTELESRLLKEIIEQHKNDASIDK